MKYHMKTQAIFISNRTNSADKISIQSYSSHD